MRKFAFSLIALAFGLYIVLQIVFNKGQFLNEAPGVAYQIHALVLLLGVVSTYGYSYTRFEKIGNQHSSK